MIVVKDATAEIHREWHEAELLTFDWVYGDVMSTEEVLQALGSIGHR